MKNSSNLIYLPHRKKSLIFTFLQGRNSKTRKAYQADLNDFGAFSDKDSDAAVNDLLLCHHGEANEIVRNYKANLIARGLSPASVNRRLTCLRSLVKVARIFGKVPYTLEVENVRAQTYRDTRGPGLDGYKLLLNEAGKIGGPKGARDKAIIRLLFDLALRRGEVAGLDFEDINFAPRGGFLTILGKGRTQKERMTMPAETMATLSEWLKFRGDKPGPLFTNLDRAHTKKKTRLSGRGLYKIVRDLGERAGIKTRPHGLRHAAITQALELTKGDLRTVARFSRHKSIQTLTIYDDNRLDLAGGVSRLLAGLSG